MIKSDDYNGEVIKNKMTFDIGIFRRGNVLHYYTVPLDGTVGRALITTYHYIKLTEC